jgi:Lysozyme like domain
MILTRQQIVQHALNAGFRNLDLSIAVAIALAESGGNPESYNPEDAFFKEHGIDPAKAKGQGSCGLWQIFRWEHPEFELWNLEDPGVNAVAAWFVYSRAGKQFTPWSTWLNESYKGFLEPVNDETV